MGANQERNQPERELLQRRAMRLLTSGFNLSPADVNADAQQVIEWNGSDDFLLESLQERYRWRPSTAARYLDNLRHWLSVPPDSVNAPTV
jgi:hypothetical protein